MAADKAHGGGGEHADPPAKKAKLSNSAEQRKAVQIKEKYLKLSAIHQSILQNIDDDAAYEWARNEVQKKKLEAGMRGVHSAIAAETFNTFFAKNDLQFAIMKFGTDLEASFKQFHTSLDPVLKTLEKEHTRFFKMHAANQS